ncbi:MAG TPA: hypothetical protein VF691_08670 [Cytophagaceae bacterium]|jgi:hypothetical protein
MQQIQILLPIYNNEGESFQSDLYSDIKGELVEKFGGLTAYSRSPAKGLWKENEAKLVQDDIVIYEIMADQIDQAFWKGYKEKLKKLFEQDEIVIRATEITLI